MEKKGMKRIVLSAMVAIVLTVGAYHIALLMGASKPAAVFTAVFTAAAVVAFAVAAFTVAAAAVVVAFASIVASAFTAAAFTAAVFTTVAVAAAVAAEQEQVRFRWAILAYGLEGLAIWGALTVGSSGWSVAIAATGVAALLGLWYVYAHLAALNAPPPAGAVPDRNGA